MWLLYMLAGIGALTAVLLLGLLGWLLMAAQEESERCPTCGVLPHKPRCRYWREPPSEKFDPPDPPPYAVG